MQFISIKGHFESDCSDSLRDFLINKNEIVAVYQSTGRLVINLKTPIKEVDMKIDIFKIYVPRVNFTDFETLIKQ